MNNFINRYYKYLPSKKFIKTFSVLFFIALVYFGFSYFGKKQKYFSKETSFNNETVNSLIEKDTDGDGVEDWEEALWGTDKNKKETFPGNSDFAYIENKKKSLGASDTKDENLTETEKFSRGFLVAFTAMKESGNVDALTINNFGSALGQKIATSSIIDTYSIGEVKTKTIDDKEKRKAYYLGIADLFDSYENIGIGNELEIVGNNLTSYSSTGKDVGANELLAISDAYKEFAEKIMEMTVPTDLAEKHLNIANAANNTGIAVGNMMKIVSDPVVGLSGLSEYQKYNSELENAVRELETTLP